MLNLSRRNDEEDCTECTCTTDNSDDDDEGTVEYEDYNSIVLTPTNFSKEDQIDFRREAIQDVLEENEK